MDPRLGTGRLQLAVKPRGPHDDGPHRSDAPARAAEGATRQDIECRLPRPEQRIEPVEPGAQLHLVEEAGAEDRKPGSHAVRQATARRIQSGEAGGFEAVQPFTGAVESLRVVDPESAWVS